ncbi:MAG: hypothetical protein ACR2QF_02575 [Geminicoccaceae bacterium]
MTNATPRPEFYRQVGNVYITAVDYRWCSAGNPEGTVVPEAGLRRGDDFVLCQHGMDHQRAVDMLANCLEHGVGIGFAAEHVDAVGRRYRDRWSDCDEDWDWQRPQPEVL